MFLSFFLLTTLSAGQFCPNRFKIVVYGDHSGFGSKNELFFLNGQIVLAGPEIALKPEFMMSDILRLGCWSVLPSVPVGTFSPERFPLRFASNAENLGVSTTE